MRSYEDCSLGIGSGGFSDHGAPPWLRGRCDQRDTRSKHSHSRTHIFRAGWLEASESCRTAILTYSSLLASAPTPWPFRGWQHGISYSGRMTCRSQSVSFLIRRDHPSNRGLLPPLSMSTCRWQSFPSLLKFFWPPSPVSCKYAKPRYGTGRYSRCLGHS